MTTATEQHDRPQLWKIVGAIETLWKERILWAIVVGAFLAANAWAGIRQTNKAIPELLERMAVVEFVVLRDKSATEIAAIRQAVRRSMEQ